MKWYNSKGEKDNIVISTEISLSRNLADYPFPAKLDAAGKSKIAGLVFDTLKERESEKFAIMEMNKLSRIQAISLAERAIISPEFTSAAPGTALMITEDEDVSIMLCEEDHITLRVVCPGLDPESAYKKADELDSFLDEKLHFAFDEKLGYLTRCPADLGTAMKASVVLHLPALTRKGKISRLASTVSKLGLVIKAAYSGTAKPMGDFYRLSNQVTLGISEESAIANLRSIALQLINQEIEAQKEICALPSTEDSIYRALGILKYARSMNTRELMELVSLIRMGACSGKLDADLSVINELIFNTQPATISASNEKATDPASRDAIRAEMAREAFAQM